MEVQCNLLLAQVDSLHHTTCLPPSSHHLRIQGLLNYIFRNSIFKTTCEVQILLLYLRYSSVIKYGLQWAYFVMQYTDFTQTFFTIKLFYDMTVDT